MTGFWQLFVGRIECRSLLGSSPTIKIVMLIFGFKERPRPFCSDPRPRRGRHILAPRDPGDPATLPTLGESGGHNGCGRNRRRDRPLLQQKQRRRRNQTVCRFPCVRDTAVALFPGPGSAPRRRGRGAAAREKKRAGSEREAGPPPWTADAERRASGSAERRPPEPTGGLAAGSVSESATQRATALGKHGCIPSRTVF